MPIEDLDSNGKYIVWQTTSYFAWKSIFPWTFCRYPSHVKITSSWGQRRLDNNNIIKNWVNKTKCQPCKRLDWPIIPSSWSSQVWKRVLTMDGCDHFGAANNHFLVYWAFFGMMTTKRQPGDPSESLLLSSEKAVVCNNKMYLELDGNRQFSMEDQTNM